MEVTVLGSGSFFIDKDHSAPGYLIELDNIKILFDCGPGTQNQLAKIDVDPLSVEYIFITHFHNDHTSDLLSILMRAFILEAFYGGRLDHKIKVVGPKGVKEYVYSLAKLQGHNVIIGFEGIEFLDFRPNMEFDDFKLDVFPVTHLGLDANALRITYKGKKMAYTGDAELCEGVERAAQDVDLLIADSATPKKHLPANAHMATVEVGKICRDNNVKKVILSHQVPPGYNVDMVGEVQDIFAGDVVLAKDLMKMKV